jgi:MFS family permease
VSERTKRIWSEAKPSDRATFPFVTTTATQEATRDRLIWTLFTGNAIGSTAYIGIATIAALIADELTGSTSLAGLPSMAGTIGVAAGSAGLSWMSYRRGRRPTFVLGYALAVLGALLTGVSILTSNFLLVLIGMAAVGFGRSVGQLSRYAAGDLRNDERRASAISLVIWASTIGAVVGPLLIGPMGSFASDAGFNELLGPVMIAAVGFSIASALIYATLRPDPLTLAVEEDDVQTGRKARPIAELMRSRTVQLAFAAVVTSQVVMVLVMVMTPVHIKANDGTLTTVGWVMMAHTLGMFAIAPITGMLVHRFGSKRMIVAAAAVFVGGSLLASTTSNGGVAALAVSMFFIGMAWNFGFVAGSTLLQHGQSVVDRLKLQGVADSSAWIASAFAAASAGVIMAASSYGTLAFFAAFVALIPLVPIYRLRTA